MFLDKLSEDMTKKYTGKVVVGLELSDDYAQVSFCSIGSGEPETLSLVMGQEEYRIPAVMGKRNGEDAWVFAKEALNLAEMGECQLVKDFIFLAEQGMPLVLEDMEYNIAEVLGLFIKKCLFLIDRVTSADKLENVVITARKFTNNLLKVLEEAVASIHLPKTSFHFVTYQESYYQYVLHQDRELWMQDVVLFDYREDGMKVYTMKMNHRTTPVVTFIDTADYPGMRLVDLEHAMDRQAESQKLDRDFLTIARQVCDGRQVSAVYLLGDGFQEEWCRDSLKYLCRNRRVFQGNNLYSKGACFGAMEQVVPSMLMQSYVYLAEDKLKSNLGMRIVRGGQECYMTLLDAGCSWYEAKKSCDLILEEDNKLPIIVTPMDGKNIKVAEIVLDGLPIHGGRTNRIHLSVEMKSVGTVSATIEDMGFGEFFPTSGQVWREEFDIG